MRMTDVDQLDKIALKLRLYMVREFTGNHGGHIGGSMDLAELLAVLYSDFMRVRPEDPTWAERDFLILSKGHAGPALYAALCWRGYFKEERLDNLNNSNSLLPGHCDRNKVPGADATAGSLGQGLSIAAGVALSARVAKKDQRVFCIMGDGESAEGQIWEAAQAAAHFHLENLVAFLDLNGMQIDGPNEKVMSLGDPVRKYESFGWNAIKVDGSCVAAIQSAISNVIENPNGKPTMIVLQTVKGHGARCIEKMENNHCIGFPDELRSEVLKDLVSQAQKLGMEVN